MPLFANRFSHKKSPSRKAKPLSLLHRELSQSYDLDTDTDNQLIQLELNKHLLCFDTKTGHWSRAEPTNGDQTNKMKDLESDNQFLLKENRLLKLKIEILMQMITEATAELQL